MALFSTVVFSPQLSANTSGFALCVGLNENVLCSAATATRGEG